ncbi:MAG: hypothetical protein U5K81_09745 [Trueperaceae bacterium]|nr:hypothetical protein [Trueperaceae bacterium]
MYVASAAFAQPARTLAPPIFYLAVTDPVRLGFSANDIRVTANQAFLDENPAARAATFWGYTDVLPPPDPVGYAALMVHESEVR